MAESRLVTPKLLFRRVAVAEAITWALLLIGMFLKYVTETTELGVRIFGMVHGVVFITYGLIALGTWINQKWSLRTGLLALVSAVPPFATIIFERSAESAGQLEGPWRFGSAGESPASLPERVLAWLTRNPALAAVVGVVAVGGLTGVALFVGPPASGS
jgi:integral membrane protein